MKHLATALAIAVSYIEKQTTDGDIDADVYALEAIAFEIQSGTSDEQQALIAALYEVGHPHLVDGLGIQELL